MFDGCAVLRCPSPPFSLRDPNCSRSDTRPTSCPTCPVTPRSCFDLQRCAGRPLFPAPTLGTSVLCVGLRHVLPPLPLSSSQLMVADLEQTYKDYLKKDQLFESKGPLWWRLPLLTFPRV